MDTTPISSTNSSGAAPFSGSTVSAGSNATQISSQTADLLRSLDELNASLDAASSSTSTSASQTDPALTPAEIPLSTVISTLNAARNKLSDAIFEAITSNTSLLSQLFEQYQKTIPGAITGGSASSEDATNSSLLLQTFDQWLDTLNVRDRSFITPSFVALMRLLPDSNTPSISQSFQGPSAAGSSSGVGVQSATQTNTGPTFYRELTQALFNELMQKRILVQPPQGESQAAEQIDQALIALLARTAALSNLPTLALLKDANKASQQNLGLLQSAEAGGVLATLIGNLTPEALESAAKDLIGLLGISANETEALPIVTEFLHQAVLTAGVGTLLQSLGTGLLSQEQLDILRSRILATGRALSGNSLTELNFSDTLNTLQTVIKGRQGPLTDAATQLLVKTLQDQGVSSQDLQGLAANLSSSGMSFFISSASPTAAGLGQAIQSNPNTAALTDDQQRGVVNTLLQFASTVTTQQELQGALIKQGAASAAPGFSSGLSQVLFGSSVNTLDGTVTPALTGEGATAPPPLSATQPLSVAQQISQVDAKVFEHALDSYAEANKTNVNYSAFIQTLLDPAGLFMKLFNPSVYGATKPPGVVGIAPQIGEGP